MTILEDHAHLFTCHFGTRQARAERRAQFVTEALASCTYDLDLLSPQLAATADRWNRHSTIHVRFGDMLRIGEWDADGPSIMLNQRFGTRGSGLGGGAGVFLHELFHGVDDLMLVGRSNDHRRAISAAFCPTQRHTWWGNSYEDAIGEAFADAGASMYGGGLRPWQDGTWGHHRLTKKVEAVIREVLE